MTVPWSGVVHVAQLVVVTSVATGGDLMVPAVTACPFWWRNNDTKGSIMGRISLTFRVKLYRIYLHSDEYRSSLLCFSIDVSFNVMISIAVFVKNSDLN